jgi:Tol biopolymer transport system component
MMTHAWKGIVLACILFSTAHSFNHPEIKWKSVSTEHFKINYYDNVEAAVYPTWKVAEEVYAAINNIYGYKLRDKINISIADYDDYSNGWAEWTASNIMIWVPDSRFDLRSNNTWLRNVITHELTHIISLENKKGLQMLDIAIGAQFQSPDETIVVNNPILRITSFPNWLSEGIAQLETEHQGNDCWDSRRDMVLRCAILDNKALTLDEMGHFNHNGLGNEMVYNHGFSFTKHIEQQISSEKLNRFFKNASESSYHFDSYFTEFTGYSLEKLYSQWRDSLHNYYKEMVSGKSTEEKVLVSSGTYNLSPELSPDGRYMAYFSSGKDDGSRTDLYVRDIKSGKTIIKENYSHTALEFSTNSDKIYFIKSRVPNAKGSFLNDIYCIDLASGSKERLTHDARVYDIAVTPDGKELLCVRYVNSVFGLYRYSIDNNEFKSMASTSLGETFMHVEQCRFDKNAYIFTKLIDGKSQLFINSNGQFRQLFSSFAQIETPMSASDGRIYFSADFDRIFNIYSIDSTGADLKRHTDAIGGYFTPYRTDEGKIIASRYGSTGFSIVEISPMSYEYTPDSSSYRCTFSSVPTPKGRVTIKAHPYQGTFLRSLWQFNLMGAYQTNHSLISKQFVPYADTSMLMIDARLQSSKSDALQKKSFDFNIDLGIIKDFVSKETNTSPSLSYNDIQPWDDFKVTPFTRKKMSDKPVPSKSQLSAMTTSLKKFSSSESDEDSSSSPAIPFLPFVAPGFSLSNELGPLNVSAGANLALAMFIMPANVSANLGLDMQICRDLFGSTTFDFKWSPFEGTVDFQMPISLYWARSGYINNDIGYNGADLSSVGVYFIPSVFPVSRTIRFIDHKDSTYYEQHNSFTTAIAGSHTFQIAKYSGLSLSASAMKISFDTLMSPSSYKDKFSDKSSVSDKYYQVTCGVDYRFPIFKDINKKFFHYWDALYGSIGYSMSMFANEQFMTYGTLNSDAFKKYSYSDSLYLDHGVHVSLTCGYYKNYLFNLNCVLDFNYYFLEKKALFSILWGI